MGRRSWPVRDVVEIYLHWQSGSSVQAIARSLGVDRKTVRKYVQAAEAAGMGRSPPRTAEEWADFVRKQFPELVDPKARSHRFSELDAHLEFIREGLQTNHVTTVWQRLCRKAELDVSLSTFRRYVRLVMPEALDPKRVAVWRPEVVPGEEAQVDFGKLGVWTDPRTGKRHPLWVFVMVLSYSRHLFAWPVLRLDKLTWLRCHVQAFAFLGGAPRRLLLDNLKDGVVKPDLYDPQLNRAYEELATYYGVLLDPCRAGHPKDKPRVERIIPYLRDSWWQGETFGSVAEMERELPRWCREVAGQRIHGTTGQRPFVVFETEERAALLPLPEQPWELAIWTTAKVAPDAHCAVGGALYSVPWRYLGQRLDVRLGEKTVQFYRGAELVKTHPRCYGRGRQTDPADLPPDRIAFFQRTPRWCREQAAAIGPGVLQAVTELLAENTLAHLRQAQGILRLAETYGPERLETACQRALAYGDPRYRTIRNILQQGLDGQLRFELAGAAAEAGACLRGPEAFALAPIPDEEA